MVSLASSSKLSRKHLIPILFYSILETILENLLTQSTSRVQPHTYYTLGQHKSKKKVNLTYVYISLILNISKSNP